MNAGKPYAMRVSGVETACEAVESQVQNASDPTGFGPRRVNDQIRLRSSDRVSDVTPTSVYLYYDETNILIYVGITGRGAQRQAEHNASKSWWQYVARQEVEHYPSRTKALARERDLVLTHTPPFNRQMNPAHEAIESAYLHFRASRSEGIDLRGALRLMQQRIDLDVHHQLDGDPIVFRSRIGDSALTAMMRLPESGGVRVFGIGKKHARVTRVDSAGPLALIRITSTSGHPIDTAYAVVKFDQKQRLVLRNLHLTLDHRDPRKCGAKCRRDPRRRATPEVRWVRPDGEGRAR